MTSNGRIEVLESFREPRTTTNPYIAQLAFALEKEENCRVSTFTLRQAILGSYDVFHIHWPEVIYAGNSGLKGMGRQIMFAAVLARIQLSRKAIVRTRHNIRPHAGLTRSQQWLEAWTERLTTGNIALNDASGWSGGEPPTTILHGHYRDWFQGIPVEEAVHGRIAYFGHIREYKGVDHLVTAFLASGTDGLSLAISGQPSCDSARNQLLHLANGDGRVRFDFRFLSDTDLVGAVTSAEMIVLPYNFMHNSGAVLAALSLNRPVLVPDTEINRRLAGEVGPGWVHLYCGELAAGNIDSALAAYRKQALVAVPDLSRRSWETTGGDHVRVFQEALERRNRRLRPSRATVPQESRPGLAVLQPSGPWEESSTFAVIVVNYGSTHLLEKNLRLLEVSGLGGHIVVVDSFTSEEELHTLQELARSSGWSVLALDRNRGFGAAVNAGARHALDHGVEALVVLNPDAFIDAGNLMKLVAVVEKDPGAMVSPTMMTSGGSVWFDGMELYLASGRVASQRRRVPPAGRHEPWISGACFAMARNLWERVGGFDEDYFLYWEDVDLSRRVAGAGGRLAVRADIVAIHDPGGTQVGLGGAGTKSADYYYFNVRNRLVFAAKHLDGAGLRRWLLATPRVSYEILRGGGRRALLTSPAPWRSCIRGLVDGHRMLFPLRKQAGLQRQGELPDRPLKPAVKAGAAQTMTER